VRSIESWVGAATLHALAGGSAEGRIGVKALVEPPHERGKFPAACL
jgi:hypothetical protein